MNQSKLFVYIIFICILSITVVAKIDAQTYIGSLMLTSQSDVDAFDYAIITGNLTIQESIPGEITNLDSLKTLITIEGDFLVYNNSSLANLSGLDALTSIGGFFNVSSNSAITDLSGLESLDSIGGYIDVSSNSALTSLSGLNSLISVGGHLNLSSNSALSSLSGLTDLVSIGGYLNVSSNSALTSLSGLDALTSIGASLSLQFNALLTNLDGFKSITSVGDSLSINFNETLSSFCGLYPLLSSSGLAGTYSVSGNLVNPTIQQIIDEGACSIEINIKVYLEGPYNNSNSNMNSTLITVIPISSPYSQDTVTVNSIPPNVVDWALVQLRDKDNSTLVITSRSVFVLNNGNIVDIDGSSPVAFDVSENDYFISIIHRNHLAVMSEAAILIN